MNEKITLPDLINLLCEKLGMDKKEAELFVKSMFELIKEYLATDKYVKVKGLGTFKLTEVESRESVHVNTGERIEIQGHTKISFTPDTTMKDLINKPFAHFESVVLNDGVEFEDTPVEAPETLDIPEEVNAPAVEIPIEMEVPTQEAAPEVTSKEGPIEEEIVPEIVLPEIVNTTSPFTGPRLEVDVNVTVISVPSATVVVLAGSVLTTKPFSVSSSAISTIFVLKPLDLSSVTAADSVLPETSGTFLVD